MSEPVFSPFFPRTPDSPPLLDFTAVEIQPHRDHRDGWETVTFRLKDGSTFRGIMRVFPAAPSSVEHERSE